MNRRTLLRNAALLGGAAMVPFPARASSPASEMTAQSARSASLGDTRNMHLSLAAYSMRRALTSGEMTLFEFMDWCAELGLPGTELTSYYFDEDFDDAYLLGLHRHAFRLGLTISGTAIRNNFCLPPGPERDEQIRHVQSWIENAARFFAPHIRIFAGDLPAGVPKEEGISWVATSIRSVLPHAAARGIMIGLENHGGITARAEDLLEICREVGDHPWFGVNLDTGNFLTNAYEELEMVAPFAVNVQLKVEITTNEGVVVATDLERIRGILIGADYRGWIALEYEADGDPRIAIPRHLEEMRAVFG